MVQTLTAFGPLKKNPAADPEGTSLIGNTIAGIACECFDGKACEDTLEIPDDDISCLVFQGVKYPVNVAGVCGGDTKTKAVKAVLKTAVQYHEGTPRNYSVVGNIDADGNAAPGCEIKHIGQGVLDGYTKADGTFVPATRLCRVIICGLYQHPIVPDSTGTIAVGDMEHAFDATGLEVTEENAALLTDAINGDITGACGPHEVLCAEGAFIYNIYAQSPDIPAIKAASAKESDIDFTYCKVDCEEKFIEAEDPCAEGEAKRVGASSVDKAKAAAKKANTKLDTIRKATAKKDK